VGVWPRQFVRRTGPGDSLAALLTHKRNPSTDVQKYELLAVHGCEVAALPPEEAPAKVRTLTPGCLAIVWKTSESKREMMFGTGFVQDVTSATPFPVVNG
jgi:hypothetical protein